MSEQNFSDDVFKSQYDYELQSKEHTTNKVQASLAIYTFILTVISYMLRMIDTDSNKIVLTLFFTGLLVAVVFYVCAGYHTRISITGHQYRVLPNPVARVKKRKELREDVERIKKYNERYSQNVFVPNPENITDDITIEWLAKCAEHNRAINNRRNIGFTKSIGHIVTGSFFLLFSVFLFVGFDLDVSSPRKEDSNQGTSIAKEIKEIKPLLEKITNETTK